ncbi:MAG: hypothetical protein ABI615_09150 [Chthoniobacterales bacterium]
MKSYAAIAFSLMLICFSAQGKIGNLAEYKQLDSAEIVILYGVNDVSRRREDSKHFELCERITVSRLLSLRGAVTQPLEYDSSEILFPDAAKSFMVFLKKNDLEKLEPVNWMNSTIPSSTPMAEFLSEVPKNPWDVLKDIFRKERDPKCAVIQAEIITGAPLDYIKSCWKDVEQTFEEQAGTMQLAYFIVGLYAEDKNILQRAMVLSIDFEQIGKKSGGDSLENQKAKSRVITWFNYHTNSENITEAIDFALKQPNERFKGELFHAAVINATIPGSLIPKMNELLHSKHGALVRYASLRALLHVLNQRGLPGIDDFRKNPERYVKKFDSLNLIAAPIKKP